MVKYFGDTINDLLSLIWYKREGIERATCEEYLRSTCQKLLFAERRLAALQRKVASYKKGCLVKEYDTVVERSYPTTLSIEMDFDHCILSLRSCLEHLAQLINALIPLGLFSRISKGKIPVTLQNVIKAIRKDDKANRNKHLVSLSSFLESEMEQDWYGELHELRIEIYHNKFGRLPRITLETLDRELIDLKFLLPNGAVRSLVTEEERSIIRYCKGTVQKVTDVVGESLIALSNYLSE